MENALKYTKMSGELLGLFPLPMTTNVIGLVVIVFEGVIVSDQLEMEMEIRERLVKRNKI